MSVPSQSVPSSDDKRTAILQTTLDLVAERGLQNAPISLIAKRSGVSVGIIYHYFAGKDELLDVLHLEVKARLGQALMAGAPPDARSWVENLKHVWLNAYRYYSTHPQETSFLEQYENTPSAVTSAHAATSARHWASANRGELTGDVDPGFAMLIRQVQQSIDRGEVRDLPMEVLYELTLGVALSLAKRKLNESLQLDDDLLAQIAEACCRAIAR